VTETKTSEFPTGILAVTTFSYELSGITAFALVRLVLLREMVMPIGRYIAWVGASLLVLLFAADWCLPKPLPETSGDEINRPVIRIVSVRQPPERIIIDTTQPTIVPPPTLVGDAAQSEPSLPPLQSYASALSPATAAHIEQKKRKTTKRREPKLAAYQPPSARTLAVASGNSATTAPLTRLSFADIISGRLVRNLFNLR
jgi:hypothetical protein